VTTIVQGAPGLPRELWHVANSYALRTGASVIASSDEVTLLLTQWREMLDGVLDDRDAVADRVDWWLSGGW